MIDAGYVNFSGENEDEELSVKVLRLVLLVLGLLLITLPFNILVRHWFTMFDVFPSFIAKCCDCTIKRTKL